MADRKKEKLPNLKEELQVKTTTDFKEAVADADQVLICVSINALEEVVKTISPALHQRTGRYGYMFNQREPRQSHA